MNVSSRLAALLLLTVSAHASAHVSAPAAVERARYLMGTICEVSTLEGFDEDLERAFDEAKRIELLISTWSDESELARLNRGLLDAPGEELRALLQVAADWEQRTAGAFSHRVKALVDAWRTREDGTLPDREMIARALRSREVEEGGFGKGYAIDRMLAVMSAPQASVNFGGQLAVRGELRVAIADPERRDMPVVELTIENASISTSSGSEKTFEHGGRRFSHIFDPRTGDALPARGSVTVIADEAVVADILSTALYVMGEEAGMRWADANGVAAIFINSNRQIRRSQAARAQLRDLRVIDQTFNIEE